jgi:hypothetical protein
MSLSPARLGALNDSQYPPHLRTQRSTAGGRCRPSWFSHPFQGMAFTCAATPRSQAGPGVEALATSSGDVVTASGEYHEFGPMLCTTAATVGGHLLARAGTA